MPQIQPIDKVVDVPVFRQRQISVGAVGTGVTAPRKRKGSVIFQSPGVKAGTQDLEQGPGERTADGLNLERSNAAEGREEAQDDGHVRGTLHVSIASADEMEDEEGVESIDAQTR